MKVLWKKLLVLSITAILSNNSFAFTLLQKGQSTPFTGVLMTEEEAKNVQKDLVELDFLRQELDHRKKLEAAYQQRIQLTDLQIEKYQKYNLVLEDKIQQTQSQNKWDRIIWFSLGFLGTAATVKLGRELAK